MNYGSWSLTELDCFDSLNENGSLSGVGPLVAANDFGVSFRVLFPLTTDDYVDYANQNVCVHATAVAYDRVMETVFDRTMENAYGHAIRTAFAQTMENACGLAMENVSGLAMKSAFDRVMADGPEISSRLSVVVGVVLWIVTYDDPFGCFARANDHEIFCDHVGPAIDLAAVENVVCPASFRQEENAVEVIDHGNAWPRVFYPENDHDHGIVVVMNDGSTQLLH